MWNLQLDLAETNGSMGCKYCGVWTICNSYSAEKNSVSIPFAARKKHSNLCCRLYLVAAQL